MEEQHSISNSTNSSPAAGSRENSHKISMTQSSSSCARTKGDRHNCSNYREITLLSFAGKILARVLLNRLYPLLQRANVGGTTNTVFALRQIQEKCRAQNKGLLIICVHLKKAFDTVSRKGLGENLGKLGCPP